MKANIIVKGKVLNYDFELSVEIGAKEYIQEQILDNLKDENPEDEELEDFDSDLIEFEVSDWDDLEDYKNLQDVDLLEDVADYSGYYDLCVLDACVSCGISISNCDEAYSGNFESDEDFAEDMAEQLGYMNESKEWPFNCIDWTFAAKELMYDYSEDNGHYFRNF